MADTSIEWTDKVWNPVVGCQKVSPGCKNCYAKTLHDQRHKAHASGKAMPKQYAEPFEVVQLMPDRLTDPLSWQKPKRVFVNSVSDLFHDDVPDSFICDVFKVMGRASRHTFQVLTKRAERMQRFMREQTNAHAIRSLEEPEFCVSWPYPNVWLGVSVENRKHGLPRVDALRETPAAIRFLSVEPLLEDLGPLDLTGVSWVIVGGESGRGSRPMHPDWARAIRDQCQTAGVAFFFKQHGEWLDWSQMTGADKATVYNPLPPELEYHPDHRNHDPHLKPHQMVLSGGDIGVGVSMYRVGKKAAGRLLDGRTWDEFPEVPRV